MCVPGDLPAGRLENYTGELTADASDGTPVVVVAGTNAALGPEDVFSIRPDEDTDPKALDEAEQAGFLVIRG